METILSNTKELLAGLGNFLSIPVIRRNQSGNKPSYPFCSYGITSITNGQYSIRTQTENLDPTKVTESNQKQIKLTISLTFLDESGIWDIAKLAEKAYQFLELDTTEFQKENNLAILTDENLTDRTSYLDPVYEYAFGFDFFVSAKIESERVVDAIDMDLSINEMEILEI